MEADCLLSFADVKGLVTMHFSTLNVSDHTLMPRQQFHCLQATVTQIAHRIHSVKVRLPASNGKHVDKKNTTILAP